MHCMNEVEFVVNYLIGAVLLLTFFSIMSFQVMFQLIDIDRLSSSMYISNVFRRKWPLQILDTSVHTSVRVGVRQLDMRVYRYSEHFFSLKNVIINFMLSFTFDFLTFVMSLSSLIPPHFTVIDKQKLYMTTFVHTSQYELPIYFVVEYLNFDFNINAGLPYYLQSEAFMEFIKICHQRDTKSQIWAKLPLFITLSIIIPI